MSEGLVLVLIFWVFQLTALLARGQFTSQTVHVSKSTLSERPPTLLGKTPSASDQQAPVTLQDRVGHLKTSLAHRNSNSSLRKSEFESLLKTDGGVVETNTNVTNTLACRHPLCRLTSSQAYETSEHFTKTTLSGYDNTARQADTATVAANTKDKPVVAPDSPRVVPFNPNFVKDYLLFNKTCNVRVWPVNVTLASDASCRCCPLVCTLRFQFIPLPPDNYCLTVTRYDVFADDVTPWQNCWDGKYGRMKRGDEEVMEVVITATRMDGIRFTAQWLNPYRRRLQVTYMSHRMGMVSKAKSFP